MNIVEIIEKNLITISVDLKSKYTNTYIFNLEAIISKKGIIEKSLILQLRQTQKKNLIIFWMTRKILSLGNLTAPSSMISKFLTILKTDLGGAYMIVYATPPYSAPYLYSFRPYLYGIVHIVGDHIGLSTYMRQNGDIVQCNNKSRIDYAMYLNFKLTREDVKFIHLYEYESQTIVECFFAEEFSVSEFLNYKNERYIKYDPSICDLTVDYAELLFIAGPPSMGKTRLARYIEEQWGYEYVDSNNKILDIKHLSKSYVIDNNPLNAHSYVVPNLISPRYRIFYIDEFEATINVSMAISSTMHLSKKRDIIINHVGTKNIAYTISDVERYFKIDRKNRFPSEALIYYIDFIPPYIDNVAPSLTYYQEHCLL